MSAPAPEHAQLLRRLARRRSLARSALWFEALWPALWPPIGVVGLFFCLGLLGLPQLLPAWPHAVLLAAFGLAFVALLGRGLFRLRAPSDAAIDRRLERASGLSHNPLALLADRPVSADPASLALWRVHVARSTAGLRRLRVGWPHPGLAAQDPMALRAGLLVALIAALVIAGPEAQDRLLAAFSPRLPAGPVAPAPLLQAWITPPAYTGVAPLFLKPEGGSVSVAAGSHLTVDLTGGSGLPVLALDGQSNQFRALAAESWQVDRDLTAGGRLVVRRHGRPVSAWDLTVVADQPPTAAWAEPPGSWGEQQQTRLPWITTDDYGVTSLQAELRLKDRPNAPPIIVPIPLPDSAKSAHGVALRDLTANPWAGLPVVGRLVARDAIGQRGTSADATFTLPERPFSNPVARALIAVRKGLSLHPENRDAAMEALMGIAAAPEAFGNDIGIYLNLSAVVSLLAHDHEPAAVPEAQEVLWQLALRLENVSPDRTARALDVARRDAQDALNRLMQGKATQDEVDRKLQALERAIEQHLQALLREAQREGKTVPFNPNAPHMTDRELQQAIERMRQDLRSGHPEDAQREMAQLQQMLQALENARPGQAQDAQNAQRQRGQQQMGALQDMLQREGGLLDHSQSRSGQSQQDQQDGQPRFGQQQFGQQQFGQQQFGQQQFGQQGNQPQGQQPGNQQGQPGQGQRDADARTQNALRRALGELMQEFGDLTGKVPDSLGQADQAMQQAGQALSQGQEANAASAEQQAIEDLQKGGQQMGQQMAQQFGVSGMPGQGQQGQDGDSMDGPADGNAPGSMTDGYGRNGQYGRDGGARDPLGRLTGEGTSGADEGNDVRIPEKMEQARSREIQNELRRREGQLDRSQEELDYIKRLLHID
jgi:uncharacterized protein (TIGR02302 family)